MYRQYGTDLPGSKNNNGVNGRQGPHKQAPRAPVIIANVNFHKLLRTPLCQNPISTIPGCQEYLVFCYQQSLSYRHLPTGSDLLDKCAQGPNSCGKKVGSFAKRILNKERQKVGDLCALREFEGSQCSWSRVRNLRVRGGGFYMYACL